MRDFQREILKEAKRIMVEYAADREKAVAWATMNVLEGTGDGEQPGINEAVTVGYGRDRDMRESVHHPSGWWETVPPVEGTRFRIFYSSERDHPPQPVREAMLAIGATRVGIFADDTGSYDSRDRDAVHFVLPDDAPIHATLSQQVNL